LSWKRWKWQGLHIFIYRKISSHVAAL